MWATAQLKRSQRWPLLPPPSLPIPPPAALAPARHVLLQGLALWGHVHNYERTCAVLNQTCQPPGAGTVHVTAGTAGASVRT